MKIFGFELKVGRVSAEPKGSAERPRRKAAETSFAAAWLRGEEGGGGQRMTSAYQQCVWVYRAVNALAEQVANIPFRFSTAGGGAARERVWGSLQEFYRRPHPRLNGFQYWEMRVIWLMLRGECFRVPVFRDVGGKRKLERIMMLDPARFEHVVEGGELVGWRYRGTRADEGVADNVFLPEEVWHERLPNPYDWWRGLSPLSVVSAAAAGDFAAGQFMKGLMENNGDAGVVVRTPEMLEEEQREQLLGALRERKRGCGTADRPLLLWGGAEVVAPTISAADLQLLEQRKFTIEEIAAAFGVPAEILTTVSAAKYDVMKGTRLNFVENRVVPLCRRLEAEEQQVVKAIEPRAEGWFEVEEHPALAEARRERLTAAKTGFEIGIPLNELNKSLDLGFKAFAWGDHGYVPKNMVKAG